MIGKPGKRQAWHATTRLRCNGGEEPSLTSVSIPSGSHTAGEAVNSKVAINSGGDNIQESDRPSPPPPTSNEGDLTETDMFFRGLLRRKSTRSNSLASSIGEELAVKVAELSRILNEEEDRERKRVRMETPLKNSYKKKKHNESYVGVSPTPHSDSDEKKYEKGEGKPGSDGLESNGDSATVEDEIELLYAKIKG
ncbi:hypothetical protein ABEB36_015555 [Hypothenemus hampei]|uniref:Uncharacterized protein n=1 Tax=Hypothenemus hampei TaxID=57062 RepID=A0ABD1DZQ5_HYPHA